MSVYQASVQIQTAQRCMYDTLLIPQPSGCHANSSDNHTYSLSVCISVFGQQAQPLCPDLNGHTQNRVKMTTLHFKISKRGKVGQTSRQDKQSGT